MIFTLAITIAIESGIVGAYASWRKKPLLHLLLSSLCANLLTQSALWAALNLFSGHYLVTLLVAEFFIWWIESLILYFYRYNRLRVGEAMALSLVMNLASFGVGWFLPV